MSTAIRKETIGFGQRFVIMLIGGLVTPFLGLWIPTSVSLPVGIALHVALLTVRRTLVVEDGVAKFGYGLVVPWWWSTIATRGVGEVGLVSRTISSGENGRRTVVDLSLGQPPASRRIWRAPLSKAAEVRRWGEKVAAALGMPFRDLVGGNGLRPPETLDLSLRERVRRHGYQRQPLSPPPGLDLQSTGDDVVMRFPHRWSRLHALYLLSPLLLLSCALPVVEAVQTGRYDRLVVVPLALVVMGAALALLVVSIGTETLPVRRLHLTPSRVTMVRRFLGIPLRKSVALQAVEDVSVVQHGAIAGRLAIASDEVILVADDALPHRDFVSAYVAQWVAFSGGREAQ